MPNILLTFLFYFILTPLSIFYRFFNKDILKLKNTSSSLFNNVDHDLEKDSFYKTW